MGAKRKKTMKTMTRPRKERRAGPGRPALNPGHGKTQPFSIRITPEQRDELEALIAEGRGKTNGDVIRWLIDESARKRK